jgi:hypothetical protein
MMSQSDSIAPTPVRDLLRELFIDPRLNAYAVLDGASNLALLSHLHRERPEFECLYFGELAPDVAACAPYLVRLQPKTAFCEWAVNQCRGGHPGIFALSPTDIRGMRHHFRKLNMVYDPATQRPLLFRYYDPRVLRAFLPTCDKTQSAEFFGPVQAYFAETLDGAEWLRFYRQPQIDAAMF